MKKKSQEEVNEKEQVVVETTATLHILKQTQREIESLKQSNYYLRGKMEVFDSMMQLLNANSSRNGAGLMSQCADPSFNLDVAIRHHEQKLETLNKTK
jgi:hypothetical protein